MDIAAVEMAQHLQTVLWPLLRIGALLLTAPWVSTKAVPRRIRVLLALALTLLVLPQVVVPELDVLSARGVVEIVQQILIGAAMGLGLQVVVAAVVVGGQAVSNAIGLSMASLIDPSLGHVPVLSQLLLMLAVLIFLAMGGHGLLMAALLHSFDTLPIGASVLQVRALRALLDWSGMMFTGGLLLGLPVMAALLVLNAGLGVVTRAAPSLNIFAVGFPVLLLVGLLVVWVSLETMGHRMHWLWLQGLDFLLHWTEVPR